MEGKNTLKLCINGRVVETFEGATILQAARAAGIDIPTFCHDDYDRVMCGNEAEAGDCGMCVCKVGGQEELQQACSTVVRNGMEVWTECEEAVNARRAILEKKLAKHPLDCLNCKKLGACKLQKYCEKYGVTGPLEVLSYEPRALDMSNRFYYQDMNKCIRCGKCVRTCRELVGVGALKMVPNGDDFSVLPILGDNMEATDCVSCGNCVSVCPVGAIMPKAQNAARVWETKKVHTTCTYCGVGCQIDLIVKGDKVVDAQPAYGPANEGLLCVKGKFAFDFVNHSTRLKTPMIRKRGKLVEATWDEALDLVASKIKEIKANYGADAIAGFSSARATNEDNYMFQKFMRAGIGTNNVDHCARL